MNGINRIKKLFGMMLVLSLMSSMFVTVSTANEQDYHPADTNQDFRISMSEITSYAMGHSGEDAMTGEDIFRHGEYYTWQECIDNWSPFHPADTNQDFRISMSEITSYAMGHSGEDAIAGENIYHHGEDYTLYSPKISWNPANAVWIPFHPADTDNNLKITLSESTVYASAHGSSDPDAQSASFILQHGESYFWNYSIMNWFPDGYSDDIPLVITPLPSTVNEGESFMVEVTVFGLGIDDVKVDLSLSGDIVATYYTASSGQVLVSAPMVDEDSSCAVIASKKGYWFTTAFTTIEDMGTPSLVITPLPSPVTEGSSFTVEVTANGVGIDDVKVDLSLSGDIVATYYTASSGQVLVSAPMVDEDSSCAVIASKKGYWFTTAFTTIEDMGTPSLVITPLLSQISEGTTLTIEVTSNGVGVPSVEVAFGKVGGSTYSTTYTNVDGITTTLVPYVDQDTSCFITASKAGYHYTTAFTTIIDVGDDGTPQIQFSYNVLQNTLTIVSADLGYYYSYIKNPDSANLVFLKDNVSYSVQGNMALGTSSLRSIKEIQAGDIISGLLSGTYTVIWNPTGDVIWSFTTMDWNISFKVISPNGGEILRGTHRIQWTNLYHPKNPKIVFHTIEYKPYGGSMWFRIADYVTSTFYDWDTTRVPDDQYSIRVSTSLWNKTYSDESDDYFTISNEDSTGYGMIYGTVFGKTDGSIRPLENVTVSVRLLLLEPAKFKTKLWRTTLTDVNGVYTHYFLVPGVYEVKASMSGYLTSTETVELSDDEKKEVNFILSETLTVKPYPFEINENRTIIFESIKNGNVGGEIFIWFENTTFEHEINIYDHVNVETITINPGEVSFIVSGNENIGGRTFVINVDDNIFDLDNELIISYDGELIDIAYDVHDILNPNDDGSKPEYLITLGANGWQILISVPHFSEHEITIYTLEEVVEALGGIIGIGIYFILCTAAIVFFVGTIKIRKRM